MFIRTVQTIIVATLASSAIAGAQEAELEDPFYIGFGGGMSFLAPESDSSALSLTEDSDFAYKLFGGYRFTQNLSMELFWSDLGAAEFSSGSSNDFDVEYGAYGIGGVYDFPLNDRWSLSAKAGIGRLENDAGDVELNRVNDNFIYVGAGATWNITGSWDLRGEYEYFDSDAQLLSLNIIKRFGSGSSRRISDLERRIEEQDQQFAELAAATSVAAATQVKKPAVECISAPIELWGVDFEFRSVELTESTRQVLDEVIAKIASLPTDVRIEIRAHTDDIGTETYNYVLSLSRARNVRDYMAQNGIALDRVDANGYGELHPVVANDTEQGRERNRRAELVLLGMEQYIDGAGVCTSPASSNPE